MIIFTVDKLRELRPAPILGSLQEPDFEKHADGKRRKIGLPMASNNIFTEACVVHVAMTQDQVINAFRGYTEHFHVVDCRSRVITRVQ